jgi:hypothetical protein
MTRGALPVRQRRAPLFGRRRRQPVVVEEPVVQRRRTSVSDKIAGALMRLQGTLTRRPGLKAAGTRRMHGTDGYGSQRTYY